MQGKRLAWFALAAPPLVAGLAQCTLDGLNSLGSGSPDSSASQAGDSGLAPTPDTGAPDATEAATAPDADSGGAPMDAAAETSIADSGAPPGLDASDAAPDVSAAPPTALPTYLDAATAGWCDLHPGYTFCADFDETPLPSGFSTSNGGYLIQTSSWPSSAPDDLLVLVPQQTGTGSWGSTVSRNFQTSVSSIALAFDVYPEIVSPGGMLFAALDFQGNASARYSVRLAYDQGAPRLEESYLGSPPDVYHSNFTLPMQAYSRVEMQLTFPPTPDGAAAADAGAATESVYINGVLQGTPEMLSPPTGFDPRPNLLIGAVYGTNPTGAWALRFDNVTLDIQ